MKFEPTDTVRLGKYKAGCISVCLDCCAVLSAAVRGKLLFTRSSKSLVKYVCHQD